MAAGPVYVDCDPGIDDALALMWALQEPGMMVVGIGTVKGNVDPLQGAHNALWIIERLGHSEVPVAIGAARALAGAVSATVAYDIHGEDVHGRLGLGDEIAGTVTGAVAPVTAASLLCELARAHGGELTILATAPLTNIALAVLLEPELPRLVRRLVVMGGAFAVPGNVTPMAEANVFWDPEAAEIVLGAEWRSVDVVGLDVTTRVRLEGPRLRALQAHEGEVARLATRMLAHYLRYFMSQFGEEACPLHDPLAALAVVSPELFTWWQTAIDVEVGAGPCRGTTVVDRRRRKAATSRGHPARVAVEVDSEAALARLLPAWMR